MNLLWVTAALLVLGTVGFSVISGSGADIWFGVFGPVAVASIEWLALERMYRQAPERLTSLLLAAFVAKMVFFAGYIMMILSVAEVRPAPFVTSFVVSFLALLVAEASALSRLTTNGGDRKPAGE